MASNAVPIEVAEWRAKAQALKELMQSPQWGVYHQQLAAHEAQAIETLVQGGDPGEGRGSEYWRGVVFGLRMAVSAPKRLIEEVAKMPQPSQK